MEIDEFIIYGLVMIAKNEFIFIVRLPLLASVQCVGTLNFSESPM